MDAARAGLLDGGAPDRGLTLTLTPNPNHIIPALTLTLTTDPNLNPNPHPHPNPHHSPLNRHPEPRQVFQMEVQKSANLKDQMGKAYEQTRAPPSRPPACRLPPACRPPPTDRRPQPACVVQLPRLHLTPP